MEHELHALTSFTDPLHPAPFTAWILTSTFLGLRIGCFWKSNFRTASFFLSCFLCLVIGKASKGLICLPLSTRCYLPHHPSIKLPLPQCFPKLTTVTLLLCLLHCIITIFSCIFISVSWFPFIPFLLRWYIPGVRCCFDWFALHGLTTIGCLLLILLLRTIMPQTWHFPCSAVPLQPFALQTHLVMASPCLTHPPSPVWSSACYCSWRESL